MIVKGPPAPDLVITEMQERVRMRQHLAQALLPLPEWSCRDGLAVEVKEVEQEKDERFGVTRV